MALTDLQTADVTVILTKHAKDGKGVRALSHLKWMLSGAYQYAVGSGIVTKNPVPEAKWLVKTARIKKQPEYSLDGVLAMLCVLEPVDIRARPPLLWPISRPYVPPKFAASNGKTMTAPNCTLSGRCGKTLSARRRPKAVLQAWQ